MTSWCGWLVSLVCGLAVHWRVLAGLGWSPSRILRTYLAHHWTLCRWTIREEYRWWRRTHERSP